MFDTINWADSLPFSSEMVELGLDKNSNSYQTKDLENALFEYMVQGGKLFLSVSAMRSGSREIRSQTR